MSGAQVTERQRDYPIQPIPFTRVSIAGGFWWPRLEANRTVTIPYDFARCEETGRISNFEKAGGLLQGAFEGIRFNDSDVFKVIEGAAYSLSLHSDPTLEAYLDQVIAKIAAAQEEDGYLYTTRTIDPDHVAEGAGGTRWSNLRESHELYNVGHLYEAAVAHYQATGKRTLLDVALKNASLIDSVFGPGKRSDVPGHQEIEIGLARLYRVTGEDTYLQLAKFFLDERGYPHQRQVYGEYAQDHRPVVEQDEAVGHAVRAGYMYSAMADVAALAGDAEYVRAIDRIWENVASTKLYLTGGIGARRRGEAFGDRYELPNATAYNETCAAIASMMWNHRLFLLHGDAKYVDVLERTLYNGFLAGMSLGGDTFFYVNPLESDGAFKFNQGAGTRQPWFHCSCCPTNVVRFLPSLSGYVYARREDALYVNLFVESSATVEIGGTVVQLEQETGYPWDGLIQIAVDPGVPAAFTVCLRIPGWARDEPVPSDLYRYLGHGEEKPAVEVNGEPAFPQPQGGYVALQRTWEKGDRIVLRLPMPVRRVVSHPAVEENAGRVALERGPIVYCAEWPDNDDDVFSLVVPDDARLVPEYRRSLLGGVTVLGGAVLAMGQPGAGSAAIKPARLAAIPYYAWSHRGEGKMAVWLARDHAGASTDH